MAKIKIDKVVSTLPGVLEPNTVYTVRVGVGFDLFISDSTGATAHALNMPTSLWEKPTIDFELSDIYFYTIYISKTGLEYLIKRNEIATATITEATGTMPLPTDIQTLTYS